MKHSAQICLVIAALVLAACSSGREDEATNVNLIGQLRDAVRVNLDAQRTPPARPRITRAQLDRLTVAALEVTLEARGLTAILVPGARRVDGGPGDVTVWRTVDDSNVILRDGVLYATRGLGRDVSSSDVTPAVRAVNTRSETTGARDMQIRNDNFGDRTLRFRCAIDVVGDTAIQIVERAYTVRHLRERCENEDGFFENDYYVDGAGTVRQSRQWAGPDLGFLSMRLLKE